MTWALLAAAVAFALVNGANTGATLLAATTTLSSIGHLLGLAVLAAGVAVAPLLVGTGVASRFAHSLAPSGARDGRAGMLVAVLVTLVVVLGLTGLGIPTGLTLAFVGSIAGAAVAAGGAFPWESTLVVLAMMAFAPLLGAAVAGLMVATLARRLHSPHVSRTLDRIHAFSFPALALGYGASDGQKMLAIVVVATGAATPTALPSLGWVLAGLGLLFALGSAAGYRRMVRRVGVGVLPLRPLYAVTSEVATASALLGSATVGAPVGVAQTMTGALVGAGASQGRGRVRWPQVTSIATAWAVTLPLTFGLAAGTVALLRLTGAA